MKMTKQSSILIHPDSFLMVARTCVSNETTLGECKRHKTGTKPWCIHKAHDKRRTPRFVRRIGIELRDGRATLGTHEGLHDSLFRSASVKGIDPKMPTMHDSHKN